MSIGDAKISTSMIRNVLIIGIPASITNIMQSFMVMTTNHYLLSYGNDKIAAMGIALKVNMITALILVGFAFGGQPLIGYNYGSKNNKRLKEILKFAYLFEMGLGLVFTIIMSVFAPLIISVFMKQSDIVSNGATMLRFQQLGMTFYGSYISFNLRMPVSRQCAWSIYFINKPSGSSVRIGTGSNVKCGRLQRNTCITGVLRCNNCGYSNKHYI